MNANPRPVVIVFARVPRLGAVKTRLSIGIGMLGAYQFYVRNTNQLVRRLASDGRWDVDLCLTPDHFRGVRRIWPSAVSLSLQGRGDIGTRMERAISRYPDRKVILIGSDIPDIQNSDIASGFAAMRGRDLVFGPSKDGGYWLTGVRAGFLARGLYDNVRWSGPSALSDTLRNSQGKSVTLLRELYDIDDLKSFKDWKTSKAQDMDPKIIF